VSSGGARRTPTKTLVAAEILMALAAVSRHSSVMKSLPWKENENA
jgi:hypothetical protein